MNADTNIALATTGAFAWLFVQVQVVALFRFIKNEWDEVERTCGHSDRIYKGPSGIKRGQPICTQLI